MYHATDVSRKASMVLAEILEFVGFGEDLLSVVEGENVLGGNHTSEARILAVR